MGLAPPIASIVGSFMQVHFGWQAAFYIAVTFGVCALALVATQLTETNKRLDPTALDFMVMLANARLLLRHRGFLVNTATLSLCMGGLSAWLSGSSFVIIGLYGVPPEYFGFFFGMVAVGYIGGMMTAGRLTMRFGLLRMLDAGTALAALAALLMIVPALLGFDHLALIIAPTVLYICSLGILMPQAQARALTPFPNIAGAASALMGFLQSLFSAAVGFLVGYLLTGSQTALPMVLVVGGCGLAGFAIHRLANRTEALPAAAD